MTQLKLTAVGLGPGDPDLITVKGMQAVRAADVVFAPLNEKTGESTAIAIAEPWLNREQQLVVPLALEMVRYAGTLTDVWAATANQMHDTMQAYASEQDAATVNSVYLILGDPSLYGTFTYIAAQLTTRHRDVTLAVIPGVTSFAAGAAAAGHPLAVMDERIAILPASYEVESGKLQQTLTEYDVVVLMKVGRVLPQMLDALASLDLLAGSTYVEKVGMDGERIIHDLRQVPRESAPYFSLIIVRKNA